MTRNDRAAVLGTHGPAVLSPPVPDGSLAIAADRRQLSGFYAREPAVTHVPTGKMRSIPGTWGLAYLVPPRLDGSIDFTDRPHLAGCYAKAATYRLPPHVRRRGAAARDREEVLPARDLLHVVPAYDRDAALTAPGRLHVVPSHERLETED